MTAVYFFGRRRIWKWILGILLTLAALAAGAWLLLFRVNQFSLAVVLKGQEAITLEYGEHYEEPGADILLRGTLFWQEGIFPEDALLNIQGSMTEAALGDNILTYRASFYGLTAQAQRKITVVDTQSPVITLTEDPEIVSYPYEEAGFSAWDNYDGDLTGDVRCTEEPGRITYSVTDSSGNTVSVYRKIPLFDPTLPRILLEGTADWAIPVGTKFQDPGFRAVDNGGEDVTAAVTVEGEVDWLTPGVYPITYTVTDADENTATAVRNVEVTAKPRPKTVMPEDKTVYLTFDDGPGPYTQALLDVLDTYHVKATFFVVNSEDASLMKEIVKRGHSIGIHSVSHDYQEIYSSPEAFFQDLHTMQDIIFEHTGVLTTLMRFPGGSSNTVSRHSCEGIMTILGEAVQNAGFQYFDWNVDSNDAGGARKQREVRDNVIEGMMKEPVCVVLQHDIHSYSVDAVEEILQWGLENGYTFKPLRENSPGFHHEIQN